MDQPPRVWICSGCGEEIQPPFDACFYCGTDRAGKADLQFSREIDAAAEAEALAAKQSSLRPRGRRAWQFTLRTLMLSMFVLCGLLAIASYVGPMVWAICLFVLVANIFGLIVAWFVTFVIGIPNDGSNPTDSEPPAPP